MGSEWAKKVKSWTNPWLQNEFLFCWVHFFSEFWPSPQAGKASQEERQQTMRAPIYSRQLQQLSRLLFEHPTFLQVKDFGMPIKMIIAIRDGKINEMLGSFLLLLGKSWWAIQTCTWLSMPWSNQTFYHIDLCMQQSLEGYGFGNPAKVSKALLLHVTASSATIGTAVGCISSTAIFIARSSVFWSIKLFGLIHGTTNESR